MPDDDSSSPKQRPVYLPNAQGDSITADGPIVIIGPNGSGKTRRAREIWSDAEVDLVAALRNTRISPQLQPQALTQAKQTYQQNKQNARSQPYELANDFDVMLTALIGETLEPALRFLSESRAGNNPETPSPTSLEKMQKLWAELFPGRTLVFEEYMPRVVNTNAVGDEPDRYSAWEMSDGEKAALYLAGRVFSADHRAVLLVDEPETHFHSLLAARFWDRIQLSRPDIRFIYVTHDMSFAASRRATQYLLASPTDGLKKVNLTSEAGDLAAVLLGTASLSFYATEIVFCEGDSESLDWRLYDAWFRDNKTVVQAVGSCDQVIRSVSALASSTLIQNLKVHGIVDRDFYSDYRLAALPTGVFSLPVHEVETLFAIPEIVEAVAHHFGQVFDRDSYVERLLAEYHDSDRHNVVLERWKIEMERSLKSVISSAISKTTTLDSIEREIPDLFDQEQWNFSPQAALAEEKARVENAFTAGILAEVMQLMPGKRLRSLPSSTISMKASAYEDLVIIALRGDGELDNLGQKVRTALQPYIPIHD